MRICQVATGMIPIKPVGQMGWGAVEKITREYHECLSSMGHDVDIKFINDVAPGEYDVVHVHMGNLALELKRRGIPYVFSLHDHHTEHYGKGSYCFRHNLEAMKGSTFSITHAEHLLDYFDETDKLFYLQHGVNTGFFIPGRERPPSHRLLMVANNGLAGDYAFDRKGFRFGIEAARALDLPITVVGTDANERFFQSHRDLLEYPKLTVVANNPCEEELLSIYHSSTIFLHPSMLEAGHPNLTLMEAAACCLPMAATYKGSKAITGLFHLSEPRTDLVIERVREIIASYDETVARMRKDRESHSWRSVCTTLDRMYASVMSFHHLNSDQIREKYALAYEKTTKRC